MKDKKWIVILFFAALGYSLPAFAAKNLVMMRVVAQNPRLDSTSNIRSVTKSLRKVVRLTWPKVAKGSKAKTLDYAMRLASDLDAVYLVFIENKKVSVDGKKKPYAVLQLMDVVGGQMLFTSQYPLKGKKLAKSSRAELLNVLKFILVEPPPEPPAETPEEVAAKSEEVAAEKPEEVVAEKPEEVAEKSSDETLAEAKPEESSNDAQQESEVSEQVQLGPKGNLLELDLGLFAHSHDFVVEDANGGGPAHSGPLFEIYTQLSFFPLVLAGMKGWAENLALTFDGSATQIQTPVAVGSDEISKSTASNYAAGLFYRHAFGEKAADKKTGAKVALSTGFAVRDFSLPEGRFPGGVSKGLYLGLKGSSPLISGFRAFGDLRYLPSLSLSGRLTELGTSVSSGGFKG
ncbi:hypothetical protein KAI87_06855, partial [Myxococcota bacterium]|nr:hypothetical protein [Myxococcota bacterium]